MAGLSLIVVLCLTSGLWLGAESCRVTECPRCEDGWTQFGCNCYKFFAGPTTWADGELSCRDLDANLASIRNAEELQFLIDLMKTSAGSRVLTFVGGNDIAKEGSWMWSDGSKFEFNMWPEGEPNDALGEDCMEIIIERNIEAVNDVACSKTRPYICSKSM